MSEARKIEQEELLEENLEEVAVLDDASAEYLLKRIKEADEQYERMESWYDHQKAKAKEIRDRTVEWAERCLRPYMDMVPTTGKKIRSYNLPGGTLKLQKQDPEYDAKDPAFLEWLKQNKLTDFIEVKESAKWGDFKKTLKDKDGNIPLMADENGVMRVVTADGELVPGIRAEVRGEKFTVTVK